MRAHPIDETRPRLLQLVFGTFVHLADDLLHRALELRAQSGHTVMHEIGDDRIVLRPVALRASARAQRRGQVREVPLQRLQYLDGGRAPSRQEIQQRIHQREEDRERKRDREMREAVVLDQRRDHVALVEVAHTTSDR